MKENFTYIDNQWTGGELGLTNPLEREVFSHIYSLTIKGEGGWRGSVRELAERLFYPKSTIAKAISNLLNRKLIVKVDAIYKAVPLRPQDVQIRDNQQKEQQIDVQELDTTVQCVDDTVQNVDLLPPIPPIYNNINELKEFNGKEDTNNNNNELALFDKFWNTFDVKPDKLYEKDSCINFWKHMSPRSRRLVIDQLENLNDKFGDSPYQHLKYFRPRDPFFLMDDEEIEATRRAGMEVAIVVAFHNPPEPPVRKYATLNEAKLFGYKIVEVLPPYNSLPETSPLTVSAINAA